MLNLKTSRCKRGSWSQLDVTSHNFQTNQNMPRSEIPVDVLRDILEYVDKAGLAIMCRVNKICCSCSQDVLYRNIYVWDPKVQQTLAQSTQLARKVRTFSSSFSDQNIAAALRNMTSLCDLTLVDKLNSYDFERCVCFYP